MWLWFSHVSFNATFILGFILGLVSYHIVRKLFSFVG